MHIVNCLNEFMIDLSLREDSPRRTRRGAYFQENLSTMYVYGVYVSFICCNNDTKSKVFSENNFEYFESLKFCNINFKMQF